MATRRFELHRDEDVSGVSGTGVVAEGLHFVESDVVVLRWTSEWPTSVVWHERGIDSLRSVHGHDGRTRIVWIDRPPMTAAEYLDSKTPVICEECVRTIEFASEVLTIIDGNGPEHHFHAVCFRETAREAAGKVRS